MKKRFLSLCMAVVLLLSVCALPAMAADGGLTVGSNVEAITGATVSTKGVTTGVNAALACAANLG